MKNNTATDRGRVLSDGTPLSALIDRENQEVALRVFADPEIHQLELERLFARAWVVVGHESEIPKPGDFVTRQIGDDPVIVVRRRGGNISCLLNVCAHRGSTVCRFEAGNATAFHCIYHSWTYGLDGSFQGAPFKNELYGDKVDTTGLRLRQARVSLAHGIIFANWEETAPSLDEYLGDFRPYLRMIFGRTDLEVIGPPQRFVIDANWKTASEQFAGDGYHAPFLHRSIADMSVDGTISKDFGLYFTKVSTKQGHGIICFDQPHLSPRFRQAIGIGDRALTVQEKLTMFPPPGMTQEMVAGLSQRFSESELRILADTPPANGGLFPNVGIWSATGQLPDGSPAPFLSIRTHVPCGIDKFEFLMWVLVGKGAPEEYRARVRETTSFSQGATGFIEQDDAVVWPGISKSARGYIARQNTLKYWAMAGHNPPEGWGLGGNVHTGFSKDDNQWHWWERYFHYLTGAV